MCALISIDEDPRLRVESFAIVNLRDVSIKLYVDIITMQKYIQGSVVYFNKYWNYQTLYPVILLG